MICNHKRVMQVRKRARTQPRFREARTSMVVVVVEEEKGEGEEEEDGEEEEWKGECICYRKRTGA